MFAFCQCVDPSANYYTKLVLVTVTPVIAIALGWVAVRAHHYCRGTQDSQNLRFWANALLFLEFVLSGVSTVGTCPAAPLDGALVMIFYRLAALQSAKLLSVSISMGKARS